MKRLIVAMIAVCALAVMAAPAMAQQTTGNIQGRIIDAQKAAVPGVTVTAKNGATGFTRTEVTDVEGNYRLNALPVGTYDVHAELSGFQPYDRKAVVVNVSTTTDLNIDLNVAGVSGSQRLADVTVEDFHRIISVNLLGVTLCTKHAIRTMVPNTASLCFLKRHQMSCHCVATAIRSSATRGSPPIRRTSRPR